MKKSISIIALMIVCFNVFGQSAGNDTTKYLWYKYQYGSRMPRYQGDSVVSIPKDTTYSKDGIARKGNKFYVGDGVSWTEKGGSSGGMDTTSLSNRINLKLNITDTSSLSSRINSKLGINDTASMLFPYIRLTKFQSDSTAFVTATNLKVNTSDTAAMLLNYRNGINTNTANIATKQNQLSGTGFVKASGTTITYDNNTYATTSQLGAKLDSSVGYVSAIQLTTPSVLYSTPINFSATNHAATATLSLLNQSAYTLFGRASGSGTPSFLSSIDSNWIPSLHSQAYYNTTYAPITRTISTTAPLTGGGDLSANRTLAIPMATNSVDGYLSAADRTAFNAKESPLTFSHPLSRVANAISIDTSSFASSFTRLGTLYNSNSWASGADFTLVGSPTISYTGNKINLSGGNQSVSNTVGTNNSAYNQVIKIASYGATMTERYRFDLKVKVNSTPGASTPGIAFGTYSISTGGLKSNAMGYFNFSTNTGTGTSSLLLGTANTTAALSPTALTFSQNDYLLLTVERIADRIFTTARNITTGSSTTSASYLYDFSSSTNLLAANTSNFSIANLGGSFIIDSISITSNEAKHANVMLVGDSKFSGYSTDFDARIAALLNRKMSSVIVSAGQSDRTQDVLNHIAEIIALAPRTVVLCIGRNDIAGGVATATWEANLSSIVSQLQAAGITVYVLDAIYETNTSQATLLSYVPATFPNNYIATYAAGSGGGAVATDGVHPGIVGAKIVADAIYYTIAVRDSAVYLNSKNSAPLPLFTFFDSVHISSIRDIGGTYTPDTWNVGDYVGREGAAYTAAFGTSAQKTRLVFCNTTNAGMDFRTYAGAAYPNPTGFRWYTALATTGTQTKVMELNGSGVLKLGTSTGDWSGGASGDLFMYYQSSIIAGSSTSINDQAKLTLFDATASTTFKNFRDIGAYKFFTSGGVSGSSLQVVTILPSGNTGIGATAPTSTLQVTGSLGLSYVAKTATYTATASDYTIDCTTGTFTVTLPTAVGISGRIYVVKNSGAGVITLATTSSQTIDGATTQSLSTQYLSYRVQSNGANWIVL